MAQTAADSLHAHPESGAQQGSVQHQASTNFALEAWSGFANHEKKVWSDVFSGKGTFLEKLEVEGETLGALTLGGVALGAVGASAGLLAIEDVGIQTATIQQGALIGALFGGAAGTLSTLAEEIALPEKKR